MQYVYVTAGIVTVLYLMVKAIFWLESKVTEEVGPVKYSEGYRRGQADLYERLTDEGRLLPEGQSVTTRTDRMLGAGDGDGVRTVTVYLDGEYSLRKTPQSRQQKQGEAR